MRPRPLPPSVTIEVPCFVASLKNGRRGHRKAAKVVEHMRMIQQRAQLQYARYVPRGAQTLYGRNRIGLDIEVDRFEGRSLITAHDLGPWGSPIPKGDLVRVVEPIADALQFRHNLGIVYDDDAQVVAFNVRDISEAG